MSTCPTCKTSYPDSMRLCPTDGTVLEGAQAPKDENIGRTLDGKYRLDKRLSSGGMGTVYKATHLMLGKSMAVKLIKADLPASPEVVRRFQREAKAASALNHPNIAPAYDLGQTQDGTLYIAMEYIDGPNLKEAIQAGPIPPARTINLLKQVASALSLAHKHEIIHRDLKPQNIMLTKDADGREVAKLLDFGIAKTLDDSATQLTATGFSLGTPQYMSPEQAYGRPVDGRSDLYSLGIILYEMLVGEVPFSDPSTPAVLVKQMTEAPIPPALKRPDLQISPELAAIALKCLEKEPAKRYQTADEFSAALDAAAASLGATILPLPGQAPTATAGAAAATVVIGQPGYAQTTQLPTPAPVPTPSAAAQTTAPAATAGPTGATTKISTKPIAQPAAAAPVVAEAAPAKPAPAPAPAAAPSAAPATAKPTGGAGSRAAVAAVIAILLLGGGAYAAYQMGLIKLGGSKDAAGGPASATSSGPATQLATAAPPASAPASAATPDPNAAATGVASAATSSGAGSAPGGASPTSGGGSGNPPSGGGASGAAPPAPPATPPSAPPANPPTAGAPTMGSAGKTSTHAANAGAPPAAVTTTPIKPAPGATTAGPAPAATSSSSSPSTSTSSTGSGATSKPASQSGAQVPAAASAAAALPANPSVAFRCDGPPDICGALKSAMDQSLSKDSMPSIRDAARADVALVGTVTFVDEQTQKMFGQSFTIRNYTIDVSGEAKRGGESVPMPSAATLNYDARYRDRLDEKARLVAASVVENIREFWKKK